ncbi:uncharacterized protein SPPG_02068 [Spizellomyces punctatus DAOM BR117]|uniref:HPP transmembrane region domain-containing protein n=1 Tax=Spizellomyces punctatus (strain DAOM BR117) TaxID=645134 RepID=A0A0L0HPV8_SPIPD|nr:uncharacterized protein SPPG_02068 [Spizellomyces punctatus DAOM BR117]KND02995.1 hypothetical protein SPPG_02068 [Spizellomyces punctatus DAOM BR117]|eukprot:XP_016611034.1 hypothetical protein SPPG_02068 [Spizellomyces punctatus DAOM BR117]
MKRALQRYWNGILARPSRGVLPGIPSGKEIIASWIATFIGIGVVTALHYHAPALLAAEVPVVVASFGASAVLIYNTIESPLSQPRCLLGGHIFSAVVGVTVQKIISALAEATKTDVLQWRWFGCALAVSCAIFVMQVTKTTHPPGGATALAAVLGPDPVWHLGYLYVASPVALGAVLLLSVAVLVNNAFGRQYPQYWFVPTPPVLQDGSSSSPLHELKLECDATAVISHHDNMHVDDGHRLSVSVSTRAHDLQQAERLIEHGAGLGVGDGQVGGVHGGSASLAGERFRRGISSHSLNSSSPPADGVQDMP